MIPKAAILEIAKLDGVLQTTIEKDYALGWFLYGIAQHSTLSQWVFKGGTCLKKCFFETYRFSEDLDFTIPRELDFTVEIIRSGLAEVCEWTSSVSGLEFPSDRIDLDQYTNKRGTQFINAKVTYVGPLRMARGSLGRIKFDLTQNEILVDPPQKRPIFHRYQDRIEPPPSITCYSVNEILAEKTRALFERPGRARDVYDVVNIARNFREEINPQRTREILEAKFAFKQLPLASVDSILRGIDSENLRAAWEEQLTHQLPVLPPVDDFINGLAEALTWWMDPQHALPPLAPSPVSKGERVLPRELFVSAESTSRSLSGSLSGSLAGSLAGGRASLRTSSSRTLDRIRLAARNRLCVSITYDGVVRIVEPYSLRYAESTGNTNLFVHELLRGGRPSNQTKSFDINQIQAVSVLNEAFTPRWVVEL